MSYYQTPTLGGLSLYSLGATDAGDAAITIPTPVEAWLAEGAGQLFVIKNVRSSPGAADRRDFYLASDSFTQLEIATFQAAAQESGEICCYASDYTS